MDVGLNNTNTSLPALQTKLKEAKSLIDKGKLAESNKLLEPIARQANQYADKTLLSEALSLQSTNNFLLGNYAESLKLGLEAEKILKKEKMVHELANAENNLGAVYKCLGFYGNALFKYLESLIYSFQTDDEYVMSTGLLNAAIPLFELGYPERALRALDTAQLICSRNSGIRKFEELRLVLLNNKATIRIKLKRYDEALTMLQQARKIATKYSVASQLNVIDSNVALCLVHLNKVEEGFKLLQSVIKRRKKVYDENYVSDIVKMGMIYKEYLGDDNTALEYLDRGLKLAESKNLRSRELSINRLLKDYYNAKDSAQALQFENRLKVLEDEDNLNKQSRGMETLFDANILAIENMLSDKEKKPEFLSRYDYLIGTYSYPQHGVTMHVPLRDIAYCEIRGNYMHIHLFSKESGGQNLSDEGIRVRKTMKEFIAETDPEEVFFARIHNSFVVNLFRLTRDSLRDANTLIIGNSELKISDTYRKSFKERLNAFLEHELAFQLEA